MSYDVNCNLQKNVGKRLMELLSPFKTHTSNIIDLGCGTGIVTEMLAKQTSYANFHAVDIAEQMLITAKKRLNFYQIDVYANDFENFKNTDTKFDLVFSNLSLHWSLDFPRTLENVKHVMNDQGILAFTIPLQGTFSELNTNSVNPFIDLAYIDNLLATYGYEIKVSCRESFIYNFENKLNALKSIKKIGANFLINRNHFGLRGKAFLDNIINSQIISFNQPTPLTYVIGFFIVKYKRKSL